MTINVHHKGDLVRISGVFKDINGTLVDPATVQLQVQDPSGNVTTYSEDVSPTEVERASTGNYYVDQVVDEAGEWHYWWIATGTGQGTEPGQFVVEPTPF